MMSLRAFLRMCVRYEVRGLTLTCSLSFPNIDEVPSMTRHMLQRNAGVAVILPFAIFSMIACGIDSGSEESMQGNNGDASSGDDAIADGSAGDANLGDASNDASDGGDDQPG